MDDITDDERKTAEPYIEAYDTIGAELAELCYRDPVSVLPMVQSLYGFIEKTERELEPIRGEGKAHIWYKAGEEKIFVE